MCVYSIIVDHYADKWEKYIAPYTKYPRYPNWDEVKKIPTQEEIDEFYKLLEKARKYDEENNQKDCEIEDKKKKLLKIAEELGIKIRFD